MLGRRSGTNSPKMDRLDFVKDSVIGELATRIGKPIPEFNKNKRGKWNSEIALNSAWLSSDDYMTSPARDVAKNVGVLKSFQKM